MLAQVPDEWLEPVPGAETPDALRAAYVEFLTARLGNARVAARGVGVTRLAYQYVVLRCVPRVEREEFVNVGVVLYCQAADFLDIGLAVRPRAAAVPSTRGSTWTRCARHWLRRGRLRGDAREAERPRQQSARASGSASSRRRSSTVLQPGPVHGGMTDRPRPPAGAPAGATRRLTGFIDRGP